MAHLYRVVLPTRDMDGDVAFYREVLGQPGESIVRTRYYFFCGGTILAIVDPSEHGRAFQPNPELVYFAVPDLEEAFERATRAGARPLLADDVGWGIRQRPWGERSFYAIDPSGNPICFVDERTVFTGSRPREGRSAGTAAT
jgi:predicted enzyme related to lactoylglutathione lyase